MPIFLILLVLVAIIICTPYILLYWWLTPVTTGDFVSMFLMGTASLLALLIVIGIVHNYRQNR